MNPPGQYYNLYRDMEGLIPIYYEELTNPLKSIKLGDHNRVYWRLDKDMKSQF
jgi:hypothetical protein